MKRINPYNSKSSKTSNVQKFAMASREKSTKSTTKKKTAVKKTSSSSFSLKKFFTSKNAVCIYGILLLLFSIFLFISIISFYFNAKNNIQFVQHIIPSSELHNVFKSIGAYLSYYAVNYFFGVASIGFSFLFFLYAIKVLFNKSPFSLIRATINTLLSMAFISFTLGIITMKFHSDNSFLEGYFGDFCANFLFDKIGFPGLIIVDLTCLILILIACFDFSIENLYESIAAKIAQIRENNAIKKQKAAEEKAKTITISNFKREDQPDLYITEHGGLSKEYAPSSYDIVDNKDAENTYESEGKEPDLFTDDQTIDDEVPFEIVHNNSDSQNLETINDDGEDDEYEDTEMDEDNSDSQQKLTAEEVMNLEPYDPRKELSHFEFPPVELLVDYPFTATAKEIINKELHENKISIEKTLLSFGIAIKSIKAVVGPTVTLYEIVPKEGVRISKIKSLEDDIALSMSALGIRIIAPIPGRGTIGIEVPNKNPKIVSMREIITSDKFQNNNYALPIGLGKTINDEAFVVDLAKMPHLLVAGATGQGKSVGLNAIITSLLYTKHPSEMKFVLVDPKKVEFTLYSTIENYYLASIPEVTDTEEEETIITDTKKVVRTLNSLCMEMDTRYDLLKKAKMRNIKEYNAKFCARGLSPAAGHRYMPYIVVVIDEFGDLIMTAGREVEQPLARLAQLARAIGIHLVIATQRPSVNIITGSIKANFPARIAFRVQSGVDSKTILDATGANQLIGKGDMLISTGSDVVRLQCAFVDTPEVEKIAEFIGNQSMERPLQNPFELPFAPDPSDKGGDLRSDEPTNPNELDSLIVEAATLIVQTQQGSTSSIQRKMSIGYNRAGRIMDQLEDLKIVGPGAGSKPRQVLIKTEAELRLHLDSLGLL